MTESQTRPDPRQAQQVELAQQHQALRQAQQELAEVRARYFELAPIGYLTFNEAGLILEANLTAAKLLGTTPDQLRRQPFSRFIHPADQAVFPQPHRQISTAETPQTSKLRLLRPDGSYFWARLDEIPALPLAGEPEYRVVLSDITEAKQVEEAELFLLQCGYSGEDFFESLARYLAQSLGMDYICIDRLEGDRLMAQTVAVYFDGRFEDNVAYSLQDTPCGEVVGKTICTFPQAVRQRFPRDVVLQEMGAESYAGATLWSSTSQPIGLIAVIGRTPLANPGLVETVLKLVSIRAAGELERKQAEESLSQERLRLRTLIDNLPDAIYIKDAQGRKTIANRADLRNIGRPESEVLGKTDAELFPPEVATHLEADDHAVLQSGQAILNRQELLINEHGQHIWLLTSKLPLRDDNGQIIGLVGIGHNITGLKQAEDLRREREAYLHAILNNSPFLMWLKDTEGRFLAVNEVFARANKLSVNEIIGKTDFDLCPPTLAERYWADDREVMALGQSKTVEEPVLVHGVTRWFETFKRPIRDENGRILGTTGFTRDITERKEAEETLRENHHRLEETLEELRQTQNQLVQQERLAAVGQLAAGIAHDFNNILTSILGFAELVQMDPATPMSIRRKMEHIITPGQRAALLVRQILDFSRKSIRQLQEMELGQFVRQTVEFLRHTIPENIQMETVIEPGKYWFNADPTQLQQVLTNLVLNARDAMPQGGQLTITLRHHSFGLDAPNPETCPDPSLGEWLALTVTDTGLGIPAAILPHIFEPFFTTKEVGQGTGLGLSQAYGIVRQHGGCIDVSSREGQGSTFAIYLPGLTPSRPPVATPAPAEIQIGSGETVLLVEDEAMVLGISRAMLEELNYRVLTAANGLEALTVFARHKEQIALVLTDMMMPGLDGPGLFRQLKAQHPPIKVVMMTGYPLGEEAAEGVVGWLHKPMSMSQLAQIISRVQRSGVNSG